MAPIKPMLGDLELQPVQVMRSAEEQVLARHAVPALEGDLFQGLGRRATRIALTALVHGDEAGERLEKLRAKFRAAEPVSFVADITTATEVAQVLVEELTVRERAGKPGRFEVGVSLCEHKEPSSPPQPGTATPPQDAGAVARVDDEARQDAAAAMAAAEDQIDRQVGTLVANLAGDVDPATVRVMATGTTDDGQPFSATLEHQGGGVFRLENVPAGEYRVEAVLSNEGEGHGG
jgi:hypothetical protein